LRAKTRPRGFGTADSPAPQEDAPILANLGRCRYHRLMCNAYEQHVRRVEYGRSSIRLLGFVERVASEGTRLAGINRVNRSGTVAGRCEGNEQGTKSRNKA
jgi:hypothetical protein